MDENERETDDKERLARFSEELLRCYRLEGDRRPGITQAWLANQVGRDQTTISNWLRGFREPPARDVFRLERALRTRPGQLSHHLGFLPGEDEGVFLAEPVKTEDVISNDPHIDEASRELLVRMYRTAREMVTTAMRRFGEEQDVQRLRQVDEEGEQAAG